MTCRSKVAKIILIENPFQDGCCLENQYWTSSFEPKGQLTQTCLIIRWAIQGHLDPLVKYLDTLTPYHTCLKHLNKLCASSKYSDQHVYHTQSDQSIHWDLVMIAKDPKILHPDSKNWLRGFACWSEASSDRPLFRYCFLSPAFSKKSEGTCYLAFRDTWFRVCSRYLVSATPPTVLDRSFWNFTAVLIMVWRFACAFYRILKLIFFTFFIFLT